MRLRAVIEVNDGAPVGEVAERYGVTRQTVTAWCKGYKAGRLDALGALVAEAAAKISAGLAIRPERGEIALRVSRKCLLCMNICRG